VVVANKAQLMNALAEDKRHIELKPGEYELQGYEVAGQLILKAQEPGVILHSRTDREDHIFKVLEEGRLDLHGIELDVKNGRKPQKGEHFYGTAASIMLDKKYDEYSLVRVHGAARLIDCNQGPQSGKGVWVGEVGSNGLMTSSGLADGVAFRGRDGGRAILMDGGVRDIEVLDGASVSLAGTGQLKSLKVSGSESVIQLNDLRQSRINHVAFHNGAQDPRSDLQRRADGRDPADVQRELISGSRRKWIESIRSSMSAEEKARNLLEHAKAYQRALAYSVNRIDERFNLAGSEVAPHMMKDRAIQREYLRLCHQEFYDGSRLFDAVIYKLSESDRNAFYAENRAVAALGKQADATELRIFASWEEAILAGDATRAEMESGRNMGLSPQGYKQAIARASRQAELREAEASMAIASGDKARIKRALQAISLDRWLQHVIDSDATTSGDIVEALAAAPNSYRRKALQQRQAQFQAAAGHGTNQQHYGSYRGSSSSYTAPNNDFARWQVQRNTWNRDMDRALDAVKSSSYRNFRNNYDF
ncbi:MAG: hypothetical protein P1V35_07895, partial [Planctomycetota bacterium]|nr:hypothetical protein [Planctomycetota bacterium]